MALLYCVHLATCKFVRLRHEGGQTEVFGHKVGRADSTAVSWHPQLCFSISSGLDVFGHSLDFLDFGSMER
ncbi:hypothetical protein BDZ89DRAFT_1078028, partial [Hymenopellis radicata]